MQIPIGRTILYFTFLASLANSAHAQEEVSPKDQFVKARKALRSLILANPENRQSISKIIRLQDSIQAIEQEHGITDLQNQLAQLRVESCRLQQENQQVRQAMSEIKRLSRAIRATTKPEREAINRLTSRRTDFSEDSPDVKRLEAKIATIQEQMQRKSAREIEMIKKLNNRIYQELPELMDAGKQITAALKEKYSKIKEQIAGLDKQIAAQVKAVHKGLIRKQREFKRLRQDIMRTRTQLSKQDPCFAAKLSAKSTHWLERFA